jgi:hypothetical protein
MRTQTPAARLPTRLAHRVFRTGSRFNQIRFGLLAGLGLAALLLISASAQAATAPDLASTSPYAIVSGTFANTTAGTTIDGDVCYTTPPALVPFISGATVVPCPAVTGTDQNAARADLISQDCTPIGAAVALNDISIGGGTPGEFPPGCYSSTGAMNITADTTVTLSGTGVYIFRPGGAITAGANSNVVVAGGVCENDVFWAPVGATTIGANANFIGNIFRGTADGLSITFGDSSTLIGRALAFGSTVTTDNTTFAVANPGDCGEPVDRATFRVIKDFTDDNPAGVEVTISCNTGLPLEQSKVITEGEGVEFVVVDFDDGEMDCEVTEVLPAGYDAEYFNGFATSSTSCEYVNVGLSSAFRCRITNSPGPVDVVIHKDWVIEGSIGEADGVSQEFRVTLTCESEIVGGYQVNGDWRAHADREGEATITFEVTPDFPSTTCRVDETVFDSAVEVDNGCGQFEVSAANGHECTITNTVFFEGIPTLNQYGLALLALLMLGLGFVGFRRFA